MIDLISSNPDTLLADQNSCVEILIDALKNGYLNLIIGAGVSLSTNPQYNPANPIIKRNGFPNWVDLTVNCCLKAKINFDSSKLNQNKYLLNLLESVREYCKGERIEFNSFVKDALYEYVDYDFNSLKTELLIAIGSLVMNSSKSNLAYVINYNFDDVLEWYLTYYGFDIQVISNTNSLIYSSDVVLYHPHGFLPKCDLFRDFESNGIILTNKDYVKATWNTEFWNSIQHTIFTSKINLFIGMSGEDTHIENLCQYAYDQIIKKERILGVMVLIEKNKDLMLEKQNLRNGIITYYIKDYEELPSFLLTITRKARGIE